ncbi:uncharacterized protein LOC5507066 [Nematostella vectensis]|uniref:uncharacterized protein LOC5507066 n=1 Tax=Nematostella vectensis TaxID=45351 RepID=UPI002076E5B1|nr:uncharacterized protein LOC5507066 [Nematostella vectensis]
MDLLPDELLVNIFRHLPARDLIALSFLCRRFRRLLDSVQFNRYVSFRNSWGVPEGMICQYIVKHANILTSLNLCNCYWMTSIGTTLLKLKQLKALDIRGCSLPLEICLKVVERNSHLTDLGWSVDKQTMKLCEAEHMNPADISEIHKKVYRVFKQLMSLKLDFFFGKSGCFQYEDSLWWILCCFLFKLKLNFLELAWPDGSMEHLRTTHEAARITIQCTDDKKERLFEFIAEGQGINEDDRHLLEAWLHHFPHFQFTPVCRPDRLLWICPVFKTPLKLLRSNKQFVFSAIVESDDPICVDMACSPQLKLTSTIAKSLRYLNLANAVIEDWDDFKGLDFPMLQSLNLQGTSCLLDSVGNLIRLKHLNLANVSYHKSQMTLDRHTLLSSLSCCTSLVSLALPSCWASIPSGKEGKTTKQVGWKHMLNDFELIHEKFKSILGTNHPVNLQIPQNQVHMMKALCSCKLSPDVLTTLNNWEFLHRLTIAGVTVPGNASFLVNIAQKCSQLEFLSLANLTPALSHSSGVSNLMKALSHCHKLKDFRLEQKYFDISCRFQSSLAAASSLERVCLIAKNGKLEKKGVIPWLTKCRKLIFVQIFCDVSKKDIADTRRLVKTRFYKKRAGLTVAVYSYTETSGTSTRFDPDISLTTPNVHLNEITLFSSRVATDWRQVYWNGH